ncbi:MAG: NUDIX domain-containing protein [archaeon]|nr:NUDIX domain-containing protein [archaeon]
MLHRPEKSRTYPGKWSLVSGHIEAGESPEEASRREIMEETQMSVSYPEEELPVIRVRYADTIYNVHSFLYRVGGQEVVLNSENTEYKWITVDEFVRDESVDGVDVVLEALGTRI